MKLKYTKEALRRVLNESGVARFPGSNCSASYIKHFKSSVETGLIRQLTRLELEQYFENRRSIRTVLLAMFNRAVEDESISLFWCTDGLPCQSDYWEKLSDVMHDIEIARDHSAGGLYTGTGLYTLTETGIAVLEEVS